MTVGEFKTLARAMRSAQKEYFRLRKAGEIPPGPSEVLDRCKELERQFDAILQECLERDGELPTSIADMHQPRAKKQGDLFGGSSQASAKPGHAQ